MRYASLIATIVCLFGTLLNVKKRKECFIVWLTGNMIWLVIDIRAAAISRVVLDIIQQLCNVWGIVEWKKNKK